MKEKKKKSSKPEIPHEILITEVLPRVQAKSLIRFKCVCKAWRDAINDPDFIQSHLHNTQSTPNQQQHQLNLLFTGFGRLTSIIIKSSHISSKPIIFQNPLPLTMFNPFAEGYPRLLGSCNGLICIQTDDSKLVLWNPCTGSYRALRVAPLNVPTTFGFGYDAIIKDYKLVRMGRNTRRVWVLTLNSNSWRTISGANYQVSLKVPGKLIGGVLYWIGGRETFPEKLICFDIHAEVFCELRLPQVPPNTSICRTEISDVGGRIALVRDLKCSGVFHEVWVMKGDWIKMYSVDMSRRHWLKYVTLFGTIKSKLGDRIIYRGGPGCHRLFSYSPGTDRFTQFQVRDFGDTYFAQCDSAIAYVESLVSVNH